jgi:predicted nucleic acid-binding protein
VVTYFADTSFWIALSSRRDQYHRQAIAWHAEVMKSGSRIVTTEAVLWAWLNALADTTTRATAAEGYRRAHADKRVEVIPFDSELNAAAVDVYRSRSDKDWSLTDCLSIVFMERRRLTEALTTDHHFEQAGMKALMLSLPSGL